MSTNKTCNFGHLISPMNTSSHHWAKTKLTVWCAIGKGEIAGPFFFDGNPVTVNSERYIEIIQRKFIPAIRRRRNTIVFQQDGAPPHCSDRTLQYLRQHFLCDRLLSRRTDNPWPPYSPDLNPADYFPWGYLKEGVYTGNPRTSEELKESIRTEIRKIPPEMLTRVVDNFDVCLAAVIQQRGAWIEHIINYWLCDSENAQILLRFVGTKSITLWSMWNKTCKILISISVIEKQNVDTFYGPPCIW